MQGPAKTIQCKCGSHRIRFVVRKGTVVQFRCSNCGTRIQKTINLSKTGGTKDG